MEKRTVNQRQHDRDRKGVVSGKVQQQTQVMMKDESDETERGIQ